LDWTGKIEGAAVFVQITMKRFSSDQLIFALVLGLILIGVILYRHVAFF
jgi:hypothetical protein